MTSSHLKLVSFLLFTLVSVFEGCLVSFNVHVRPPLF